MRRLVTVLASAALLAVVVHPASAAGPLHVKDLAGDANGINGQDIGLPLPQTATAPAQLAGADIVGLDVVTRLKTIKGKKAPYAAAVTLTLGGPVPTGVNFVVIATAPATCDGESKTIQLGYEDLVSQRLDLTNCQAATEGGTSQSIGFVEVDAAKGKITWVIEAALMGLKPGQVLTDFKVTSTVFVVGVFDEFFPKGTFTFAR